MVTSSTSLPPSSLKGSKVFDSLDEALKYTRNLNVKPGASHAQTPAIPKTMKKNKHQRSSSAGKNTTLSLHRSSNVCSPTPRPSSSSSSSRKSRVIPITSPGSPRATKNGNGKKKHPVSDGAMIAYNNNNNIQQKLPRITKPVKMLLHRSKSDGRIGLVSVSSDPNNQRKMMAEAEDLLLEELVRRRVLRDMAVHHPNTTISTITASKSKSKNKPNSNRTWQSSTVEWDDVEQHQQQQPRQAATRSTNTTKSTETAHRQQRGALVVLSCVCLGVAGITLGILFGFDFI